MPVTDEQRAELTMLGEADAKYRDALEDREEHLKSAVRSGAPFDDIGLVLGVTGRAVARVAERRGWYKKREYHRRG